MDDSHQHLVVYCLLPVGTDASVADAVREHYARSDPRVEVVIDRRMRQRRAAAPPAGIVNRRRGTDRRRATVPRSLPPLPAELARAVSGAQWVQRMLPVGAGLETASIEDVVAAVRNGDPEAPTELYWRWYERLHSRLCVVLGDAAEADRMVVVTFGRILDALEDRSIADVDAHVVMYAQIDASAAQILNRRRGEDPIPVGGLGVSDPDLDEAVVVREGDTNWHARARSERDRLLRALGDAVIAVEHVGSTSVDGLPARPTLDLMAGVDRMPPDPALVDALADLGYEDCGDGGTPGRQYLRRRGRLRVDLHIVDYGGALWLDAIALRDHLRADADAAARWGAVKRDAARVAATSALRYCDLRRLALDELLVEAHGARGALDQRAA